MMPVYGAAGGVIVRLRWSTCPTPVLNDAARRR
jgi:hypothetical protein